MKTQKATLKEPLPTIHETQLEGLQKLRSGKVRDVYEFGDHLLMIATDRISAFDVVLPTPIPLKGAVLTQLSRFWFDMFEDQVPNHLISADVDSFPDELRVHRGVLNLRAMLTVKADMFPVECVARGYVMGSAWKEYQASGKVCGIQLPAGLRECDVLPEPIFTPATKAETGHDINITFEEMCEIVGMETSAELRRLTLSLYEKAADYAMNKGIIIADTKFEFGVHDDTIILCDEVLTPDSSRFWPRELYQPGRSQMSFDKQYVRDYLEEIDFNKQPPGPELPDPVTKRTSEKYLEAFRLITGSHLIQS